MRYNIHMETIYAYAKVNLMLSVEGKRPDGYHELRTIMHSIDLFDTVTVQKAEGIAVACSVPLPEDNTAIRAAKAYGAHAGYPAGAHIRIEKRIPSEAGLGGASADAAAVLIGLQRMYGLLAHDALMRAAKSVGADVPFCIKGGCALAEGIGERLTPLPCVPLHLLIVKGTRGISTKELFSSLSAPPRGIDPQKAILSIRAGDVNELAKHMHNALEPAAIALVPKIAEYKKRLTELGALCAVMTGSGSAVAGVFESRDAAQSAAAAFPDADFAFTCGTICV